MTKAYGPFAIDAFTVDQRVELHPATDLWMRGARYGNVTKIGRTLVHIALDMGKTITIHPRNIGAIIFS